MKQLIFCLFAMALVASLPVEAGKKKKKKAKVESTQEAKKKKSPYKDFKEITQDAAHHDGYFELYQKDDHLYLLIPESHLGKDFLLVSELAQGIGAEGLNGGSMLDWEGNVVAFERHGNRIYLLKRPVRYSAGQSAAIENALQYAVGDSVLQSAKIESIKKPKPPEGEGGAEVGEAKDEDVLVIDIYPWVVSDLAGVTESVKYAVSDKPGKPGSASFDKNRSFLHSVKAFPHNVNINVKLTYRPSKPTNFPSVPDNRYLTLGIYYTMAMLPEEPMEPRFADERIGLFMTVRKDFSKTEDDFFVRYVRKWRLEPGEKVGDLYLPKKPIIYYLDHSIPEEYRGILKEGVEAWNDAFEQAGFKDAIRAEMLPEDADPEDIRYPTLRWITSDQPSYGAIGPSVVDPRTGEILDADILFEANMVLRFSKTWRHYGQPSKAFEQMFTMSESEARHIALGGEHEDFYSEFGAQGMLLRSVLMARGDLAAGEPVPKEHIDEAMKWVTMHEVGHTLGLYHNFRSSSDTPYAKLHDKEWVKAHGLYGSVMDYPTINVSRPGQSNGFFYSPSVGTADKWTISYGYTPDADKAREIARLGARDGHAYGNDGDARGSGALDPHTSVYDLSDDPITWGEERTALIRELWTRMPEYTLYDDAAYEELTSAFHASLFQYVRALAPAVKHIGGQYTFRDHYGDPNGRPPFRPVAKDEQRRALNLLAQSGFGPAAFAVPAEVAALFGGRNWRHWGSSSSFDGRKDYPYYDYVLNVQKRMLSQLTHPLRLAGIRDAEFRFGQENLITIPELMDTLTQTIWQEVWESPGADIPAMRRDIQRAHLDRLVTMLTNPPRKLPADARSVTRMQLRELKNRIEARLEPPAHDFDAYTRAHLHEAHDRIGKALEAGLEVEKK